MCINMCTNICIDMRADLCTNMCASMCTDMYIDMCIDMVELFDLCFLCLLPLSQLHRELRHTILVTSLVQHSCRCVWCAVFENVPEQLLPPPPIGLQPIGYFQITAGFAGWHLIG